MAQHIKIKTSTDHFVHFDRRFNSTTLCLLETGGDESIGIKAGVITTAKVNCPDCIAIINFCKNVLPNEIAIKKK